MDIAAYGATMAVKYSLESKTSSGVYDCGDPQYDNIDKNTSYNLQRSNLKY